MQRHGAQVGCPAPSHGIGSVRRSASRAFSSVPSDRCIATGCRPPKSGEYGRLRRSSFHESHVADHPALGIMRALELGRRAL
jgi:hypothetical protein